MTAYDIVFLGSSPNALTAAAYLAQARKNVLVLEPSAHLGGGVVTTAEFAPGFRADMGLISGRLSENVVRDLKLNQHGLEVIERDTISSLCPGGKAFTLSANRTDAAETIKSLSTKDAAQYAKFMQLLDMEISRLL